MLKAIVAVIVSFTIGLFAEAAFQSSAINMEGAGILLGAVVMGGFVIYFNEQRRQK